MSSHDARPHDAHPPGDAESEGPRFVRMTPEQVTDGGLDTPPDGAAFRGVVYVAPPGPAGEAAVTEALQGVFALLRRLAARPPMPDLLIVTTAAHQVVAEDVVDPFMTALWGLGRTLRVEHPRSRVRLVDLGPGNTVGPGDDGAAILREVLGQDRPELALRHDTWYEPSVQPRPRAAAPTRCATPVAAS